MINRTLLQYAIKNIAKNHVMLKYRLPHTVGKLRLPALQWYQFWSEKVIFSKRERAVSLFLFSCGYSLLAPSKKNPIIKMNVASNGRKLRNIPFSKRENDGYWQKELARPFLARFSKSLGLWNLKWREEFKYDSFASIRATFYLWTEAPSFYPWLMISRGHFCLVVSPSKSTNYWRD